MSGIFAIFQLLDCPLDLLFRGFNQMHAPDEGANRLIGQELLHVTNGIDDNPSERSLKG